MSKCRHWYVKFGLLEKCRERLGAFEMWCYRRMLKIKSINRIPNEEVLERIGKRRTLWKSLRKRRSQMMGLTLRYVGLDRDILGKKRGKLRLDYFS